MSYAGLETRKSTSHQQTAGTQATGRKPPSPTRRIIFSRADGGRPRHSNTHRQDNDIARAQDDLHAARGAVLLVVGGAAPEQQRAAAAEDGVDLVGDAVEVVGGVGLEDAALAPAVGLDLGAGGGGGGGGPEHVAVDEDGEGRVWDVRGRGEVACFWGLGGWGHGDEFVFLFGVVVVVVLEGRRVEGSGGVGKGRS